MKEWKNVKLTSKGQEYVEPCELKTGLRSSSRAVFFRNTHQTTGEKIVSLKIARYRKVNGSILLIFLIFFTLRGRFSPAPL